MTFVLRRLVVAVGVLPVFASITFFFLAAKTTPLAGHPLLPAYWAWLKGFGTGRSFHSLVNVQPSALRFTPAPLWPQLLPALGRTAVLLAVAFVFVAVFGLAVGLAGAHWRRSAPALLLRAATYLAWATPAFLLALLIQQVAASVGSSRGLGPFPIAGWPGSCPTGIGINSGRISPCAPAGTGAVYVLNVLRYVTLPAATLAMGFVGLHGRYLRSTLVETLGEPFITTARAKGLAERHVLVRHALRASLATFVSVMLSDFGSVFGAALAVDWIFKLNGLGSLLLHQFPNVDNPVPVDTYLLEVLLIITGAFVLAFSMLSELATRWFDPRTRGAQ
jgi:peptide/nickel transport system permease protein